MSKLEEFYDDYGYEPKKKPCGVVSPGAKSKESLLDKIKRNIELDGNHNFTLSYVGDLARCSILCEFYKDIPKIILQLKKTFLDISGYISRCPNGYRGIHLNTKINGINTEIQLCTPKAYEYAQAAENIYTKWRSLNPKQMQEEINELEQQLKNLDLPQEKQEELEQSIKVRKKEIIEKQKQKAYEYKRTDELFKELHSDGEFEKECGKIESYLLSFRVNENGETTKSNPILLEHFQTEDGKVDKESAISQIDRVYPIAEQAQEILISKVKEMLKTNEFISEEELDKSTVKIIQIITETYDQAMAKKIAEQGNEEYFNTKIRDNSIQKSNVAIDIAKFCKANNISAENFNTQTFRDAIDTLLVNERYKNITGTLLSLDEIFEVYKLRVTPSVEKVNLEEIKRIRSESSSKSESEHTAEDEALKSYIERLQEKSSKKDLELSTEIQKSNN